MRKRLLSIHTEQAWNLGRLGTACLHESFSNSWLTCAWTGRMARMLGRVRITKSVDLMEDQGRPRDAPLGVRRGAGKGVEYSLTGGYAETYGCRAQSLRREPYS